MAKAYIGQVVLFPDTIVPSTRQWMPCDGRMLSPEKYREFFCCVIGYKFGRDIFGNFMIPNMLGLEPLPNLKYYIRFAEGKYPRPEDIKTY